MLEERMTQHHQETVRKPNHPFYNALNKYGWDNFTWEIFDESAKTQEELNNLEKLYIKKFNVLVPNGYNLREGGSNGLHSEESKEKNRLAHLGVKRKRPHPVDCKCASCISKRGEHVCSEETKKKQSKTQTGKKRGPYKPHKIGCMCAGCKNRRGERIEHKLNCNCGACKNRRGDAHKLNCACMCCIKHKNRLEKGVLNGKE